MRCCTIVLQQLFPFHARIVASCKSDCVMHYSHVATWTELFYCLMWVWEIHEISIYVLEFCSFTFLSNRNLTPFLHIRNVVFVLTVVRLFLSICLLIALGIRSLEVFRIKPAGSLMPQIHIESFRSPQTVGCTLLTGWLWPGYLVW